MQLVVWTEGEEDYENRTATVGVLGIDVISIYVDGCISAGCDNNSSYNKR